MGASVDKSKVIAYNMCMAKKVIVKPDDDSKPIVRKKKRSKCCTCLIAFAIFCLVIIAAVIGVGWYFGDKYTRQYFDMSLGETFDVLGDLYWTDEDDVVKRPYSKKDANGFYNELKKNVLLKTDTDIDFDGALISALDKLLGTNMSGKDEDRVNAAPQANSDENGTDGKKDSDDNVVVDMLVDMLSEVFTKENIDIERLKEYDDLTNDTYKFELKDKQIAALVSIVLDTMLKNAKDIDFLSGINEYIPLKKVVKLKQVRYVVQAKTDEQGVKTAATAAEITVWLGMQDAAGSAIKKMLEEEGYGWAGGFVAWLGDVILPENVYLNVTVPLEDGAEPILSFNTMNAAERKQMYKLMNGVFKNIMNSDMTVDSLLNDFASKMKPFLKQAADSIDFTKAAKGSIEIDIIDTLAKTLNKSTFKNDQIEKKEIMYMLQALLTTTPEARLHELEPYLYRDWYVDAQGNNAVYKYNDSVNVAGKTRVNYSRLFIDEIEEVYSLDFGEDAEVSDVLAMLGISIGNDVQVSVDTETLLEKIDRQKLNASLNPNTPIRNLRITDRMLASALAGELDKMLADQSDLKIDLNLDAMTFVKDSEHEGHTFALLAVEIGIDKLFESLGDNKMFGMITGLLPDSILMNIQIDITLSLAGGDQYVPAKLMLNDYERTETIIATLKKFMPELDLNGITTKTETTLRKMLGKLDELLGIELVRSDLAEMPVISGELVMPDLYTVVVNTMLTVKDENDENYGKPVVNNEQLRRVLYGLNNTAAFDTEYADGAKIDTDTSTFIADVVDKYYLNDPDGKLTSFNSLTDFLTSGDSQAQFGKKFRVKGTDINVKYLAYDTRTIGQLTPLMTGEQLGAIIDAKKEEMGGMDDIDVLDVGISETSITVTMGVNVLSLIPSDVQSMMSSEMIYFTVIVDISTVENGAYPVGFAINSMTGDDVDNLLKIIELLGGSFDIGSKTAVFGRMLYEQLGGLSNILGGDGFLRFTDDGIELASFYEFLSTKLGIEKPENKTNAEWAQVVKNVVQGMFERPKDVSGNYIDEMYHGADDSLINNYRMSDFVVNAPSAEDSFDIDASIIMSGGGVWYDKQFNSWIQVALNDNDVTSLQTIALVGGDDGQKAIGVRSWVNARMSGSPVSTEDDHIIVSFKLPMGKFSDSGDTEQNTDMASGFLPDYICATVALDMVDGTGEYAGRKVFECVGTVVNNLNAEEYDLLVSLMGLSPDTEDPGKVNLKSITKDCVNQINSLLKRETAFGTFYGSISLIDTDNVEKGIGKVDVRYSLA